MSKHLSLLISCLLLIYSKGNSQNTLEKELFHKIEFTASSVELLKWNINSTKGISFVKETIDKKGRTTELRFFDHNGNLSWVGAAIGAPIIKYEYLDNKIIETFYLNENSSTYDFYESELPYKQVYLLDDNKNIIDCEIKYNIEFNWSKNDIERVTNHLENYKNYTQEDDCNLEEITGYNFAYAKFNRTNPKRID